MSNQRKCCPLCMEEMDLTDQQLKPCKCGYEMCVWCWHHIIEMAKKDDTEGRCPACRSPYDKERILGRTISSERLAELNFKKKQKLRKAKLKTSEVRSDLTTVRVIKRDLVYVAGLPGKIADEETLRKKEFLGQYGKITKIVIARDVGTNRLFPSFNTSVVYVTFSKEQEALRCIEVVNGFILDGRPLKACFGTTRYCHAWLKNMPCRNPNCFYLHDAGPQEDICTKDEVASACLSKLPQNPGIALHNFERRAGSVLPPPRDNFCGSNSSVVKDKFLIQSVVYTPTDNGKRHFQNGDSGKSGVLPVAASWGSRLASGRSSFAGVAFCQGTVDHPSIPASSLAGVDIQALPQNAYQTQRQMIMSRNQMPLSNGRLENIASLESYIEDGFREDRVVPNFKSSNYTNIMTNNTVSGSCCVTYREDMESRITQSSHPSDSVGFSQQPRASFSDDVNCSTMVENSQASCCIPRSVSNGTIWDSGCLYGITEGVFSPVGYPVASMEDTPVSNLQAAILDPVFRSASSSQSLPRSFNQSSKFTNMIHMRSSANFEAKDISLPLYDRKFEGASASVPGGTIIADPRVGEHSTCSVIIGLSCKGEQRKLQGESSSCGINNFKLQHLGCQPDKPISTEIDMVLDFAASNKATSNPRGDGMTSRNSYVDFREDNILPDKAKDDAGEDSIISDILSLDLGQVDHLIDHYSLRELLSGTNESDYSKSYNSWMPCNSSESKFSFASLDDSDCGKEQSFPLDSNAFALDIKTDQLDIKENKVGNANTSLSGLSAYEILNSHHRSSACDIANESKLPSSLHQSASPISGSEVLPSSGFPAGIRSIPPGFHPRYVDDQYQAFSKLTNSGSIAQYQISGNSPCINSSQENPRYSRFNDPQINQINDSATASPCKGKLSQSMIRQFSLSSNSSLDEADQRLQFQARLGDLTQNPVTLMNQSRNMTFQDMVNNYDGAWGSCNISSPTAMESGVTGRGQSALSGIIHHLIPGSKHGSWRHCHKHEKPCFQVPDSSRLLFDRQYEQS